MDLLGNPIGLGTILFLAGFLTGVIFTFIWIEIGKQFTRRSQSHLGKDSHNLKQTGASIPFSQKPLPITSNNDIQSSEQIETPLLQGKENTPQPAQSMVQQIDEILQAKLAAHGQSGLSVWLEENPQQGVIVRVGTETYSGIDSIPDIETQNLIKAAVAEWEKRSDRGSTWY